MYHRIPLPTKDGLEFLPATDILYIQASGNYSIVYTYEKKPIYVFKPLKSLEESMIEKGFIRIHNMYVINVFHLLRYSKGDGGTVELSNGKKLEVSRGRKREFLRRIKGGGEEYKS